MLHVLAAHSIHKVRPVATMGSRITELFFLSHEYSRSNYKYSAPTDLSQSTSEKATMPSCNFQINREVKQTPGMEWHQENSSSKRSGMAFTFEKTLQLGQWTPIVQIS